MAAIWPCWTRSAELITYPYLHRLPPDLADVTVSRGEGLSGEVMTTGQPTVIDNYKTYPRAVPAFVEAGLDQRGDGAHRQWR